ncbi:MAG TPA: hypothetical protein VGF74_18905 [Thermoleophilaceae bacterium]|jgi:hypothetical protein
MNRQLAATTLALGALALPAAPALASIPHLSFKKPSIVPGKSIGGVKVGMTKRQAVAKWGTPDRCLPFENDIWCQFLTRSPVQGGGSTTVPFAGYYLKGGKVTGVEIGLPDNSGSAAVTKVKKLKTAKKVGLGSAAATVRSKYGIPTPPPGEATASRNNLKTGRTCTSFYAPQAPYTTITGITVGLCGAVVDLTF